MAIEMTNIVEGIGDRQCEQCRWWNRYIMGGVWGYGNERVVIGAM